MKPLSIAVHHVENPPYSLHRYFGYIKNLLIEMGAELHFYQEGEALSSEINIIWDPFCGWPQGPVWPTNALSLPKVITFHGAAAFSLPANLFWGDPVAAIANELSVEHRLIHWLYQSIDAAIVPSRFARWELKDTLGIPPSKIFVAEHGIDTHLFSPLACRTTNPGFLHVSAWQPKKNLFSIIEAYEGLPESNRPPLHLIVPQLPVQTLPTLPGLTVCTASQTAEELRNAYASALAFLFPSFHETFGMPVLEAMSCGCPVITAQGSALEELYAHAALLVDPEDSGALRTAMIRLWLEPELRDKLRQAGLELARKKTWHDSAKLHLDVFSQLVDQHRSTRKPEASGSTAVFLLGMHRSGTSALAGSLHLAGINFGPNLLPPQPDNPKGFFEHREIVMIHDQILQQLGSRWDDPSPLPQNWEHLEELQPLRDKLSDIIDRDFSQADLWALKDPRLCRLLPLWLPLLAERHISLRVILLMRDSTEVSDSLAARSHMALAQGQLLWLRYLLEAEKNSRSQNRIFLTYDTLLQAPYETLEQISTQLNIVWPFPLHIIRREIPNFLDPSLRHQISGISSFKQDTLLHKLCHELMTLYGKDSSDEWDNIHAKLIQLDQEALPYRDSLLAIRQEHENCHQILGHTSAELLQTHRRLNDMGAELLQSHQRLDDMGAELVQTHQTIEETQKELSQTRISLETIREEQHKLQTEFSQMLKSRSWRMTKPLRLVGKTARKGRHLSRLLISNEKTMADARYFAARSLYHRAPLPDGLKKILRRPFRQILSAPAQNAYQSWISKFDTLDQADRKAIAKQIASFDHKPFFSVLLPTYNTPIRFLRAAIESVRKQLYPHWELCIADDASQQPKLLALLKKYAAEDPRIQIQFRHENGHISLASNTALAMAHGEYVVLLDHDDLLAETALYFVALEINQHPDLRVIYSDEDKVDAQGRRLDPYFKPDYSYDLLLGQNMISHLGVYQTQLVRSLGGFRQGFEGAQDWDLALRCIEQISPTQIRHIPRILYHWRIIPGSTALDGDQKPYAYLAQRRTLEEHVQRQALPLRFLDHPLLPGVFHRAQWALPTETPLVSILIPTHNAADLLRQCIQSVREHTDYRPYEILVIDNRSNEPEILAYLQELRREEDIRVLVYDAPFNFAAINNFGATHARGQILLLLNNDTQALDADWLREMVSHCLRPQVGAVGAKLLYPDGSIQHGGVLLGLGGYAAHAHRGFPGEHPGQSGRLWLTQNFSAVTAACLAVRKEVFERVGGLDEEQFPVAYNDVDFCLRLRELGYDVIFTPFAELLHHESKTRGLDTHGAAWERFQREKAALLVRHGALLRVDPFYNPNLTLDREDFSLAETARLLKPWQD